MNDEVQPLMFQTSVFKFAERFMADHAGRIITDSRIAIVEMVANAYDAGATKVEIVWPKQMGDILSVTDNGTGLTRAEFDYRWRTFNYDRLKEQGNDVEFPPEVKGLKRSPFGQSGKGRYAPFCFAESYEVLTWKDGKATKASVSLVSTREPFDVAIIEEFDKPGHGTVITANVDSPRLDAEAVGQLIGSKFLIDPSINVFVDGKHIQLLDLEGIKTEILELAPYGRILIHFIDTSEHSRTVRLRGITWWVMNRMVGEPGWESLDGEGAYLDGRREEAKRYSFVVEADFLKPVVKADWTDFHSEQMTKEAKDKVHHFVVNKLFELTANSRKHRKIEAMEKSRRLLGELPTISKKVVSRFINEVLAKCPSISDRDLQQTVEILGKLEASRWQYDLLGNLASCSIQDLDRWTIILKQWSASSAELVLGELQRRLHLIEQMQGLVEDHHADELHQLQPLFERGLWIFGTEYEAVDFRSNRGLKESIVNFLGKHKGSGSVNGDYNPPNMRIDLIAIPSVEVYAASSYKGGKVDGIRKVLIIELKRGGFRLTQDDTVQALKYCKEVKRSGRVQKDTEIEAVVLGASKEEDLEPLETDNNRIRIIPRIYDSILHEARLRTFDLERKLKELDIVPKDPDVERIFKDQPLLQT